MSSKEFEIARLLVLQAAHEGKLGPSEGYAWSRRIFPLAGGPLANAFRDDFDISEEQVAAVLGWLDKRELDRQPTTFYQIEDQFDARGGGELSRFDLIAILRMAKLDSRFLPETWEALTVSGSGPIESQSIADDHDPDWDFSLT